MKNPMILRAAAPAAFLALSSAAFAADLRVGPGEAHETIQSALDAASPGDRVLVRPGVYRESVRIDTERVSLIGDDAVIDGGSPNRASLPPLVAIGAGGVSVRGFLLAVGAEGVIGTGDGIRVTDCSFTGIPGSAIRLDGAGNRVERCDVFACGGSETVSLVGSGALIRKVNVSQCTGRGLYMIGEGGRITASRVEATYARGIDADVPGGSVDRCTVTQAGDFGILVSGTGVRVERNVVEDGSRGIDVSGDRAVVQRNAVEGTAGTGIRVTGYGVLVASNTVDVTTDDADGMRVEDPGSPKSALRESAPTRVTRNSVTDAVQNGFVLRLTDAEVSLNRAIRCGSEEESGFEISASNCRFSRNQAVDCYSVGFDVSGTLNSFSGDRATGAAVHGIRMAQGSENTFRGCTATGCDGQGFYNEGIDTTVLGGAFTGNRMDVANDGSFLRFTARYVTGGPDQAPIVR